MIKKKNPYKAKTFSFKYLLYDFFKWSGFPLFLWFRNKKIYLNKKNKKHFKGGAILICNHVWFSDTMILLTAFWFRRLHFAVMNELFKKKLSRFFFKTCLCTPIDRQNFSIESFREIVLKLQGGNIVTFFPEGHISREKEMDAFKSGFVLMALQGNVPIIPVYRGVRKKWWHRQIVVICEPIDVKEIVGNQPNMCKIEEATKILFNKEKELEELYLKEINKNVKQ